jgi:hypothetical protein
MRTPIVIGIAMLALAASAYADPPARITIVSVFDPVTYGENAYVNGQLLGDNQAGQLVALEQSPPPFSEWTQVLQTTSDAMGYYSFKLHPATTMQYRTSSQGASSERFVQVAVAPRIRLQAVPVSKTAVRFSGTFAPALPDQTVAIQRQLPGGGWATITRARLRGGKTFSGRFRARHTMNVRAFFQGDGAHADGASKVVKIRRGPVRPPRGPQPAARRRSLASRRIRRRRWRGARPRCASPRRWRAEGCTRSTCSGASRTSATTSRWPRRVACRRSSSRSATATRSRAATGCASASSVSGPGAGRAAPCGRC